MFKFIDDVRGKDGWVLVYCNVGIFCVGIMVIGYFMRMKGLIMM